MSPEPDNTEALQNQSLSSSRPKSDTKFDALFGRIVVMLLQVFIATAISNIIAPNLSFNMHISLTLMLVALVNLK